MNITDELLRQFEDSFASFGHLQDMPSDFEGAGLESPTDRRGGRRGVFRSYTASVDQQNVEEVKAVLDVFALHLRRLEATFEREEVDELHRALHQAGFCYSDGVITNLGVGCPGFYGMPTGRWSPNHFRLFISHVSSDSRWVSQLSDVLKQDFGISGFVAHISIEHSAEWQQEIENALREMDALLAVFAGGFRESQWADQEVGFALGRDVPVVNVLHGATPHGFVARWQGIPARDRETSAIGEDICSSLSGDSRSKGALGEALAVKFARSRSYDAAQSSVERLAETAPLSEKAVQIALRGFKNNPECRYAAGVREKLMDLVGAERLEESGSTIADGADAIQNQRTST